MEVKASLINKNHSLPQVQSLVIDKICGLLDEVGIIPGGRDLSNLVWWYVHIMDQVTNGLMSENTQVKFVSLMNLDSLGRWVVDGWLNWMRTGVLMSLVNLSGRFWLMLMMIGSSCLMCWIWSWDILKVFMGSLTLNRFDKTLFQVDFWTCGLMIVIGWDSLWVSWAFWWSILISWSPFVGWFSVEVVWEAPGLVSWFAWIWMSSSNLVASSFGRC